MANVPRTIDDRYSRKGREEIAEGGADRDIGPTIE
jgi:hypothetical protein